MDKPEHDAVQTSYDILAETYVEHLFKELDNKPLDRELLNRFAEEVKGSGLICDLGCGPGHVAKYLSEQSVTVCGIDLSPAMIEQARKLNPAIDFQTGDMLALEIADHTFAGLVAFYSIVNLSRGDVQQALFEMHRVLKPGGRLLLAFHVGDEMLHVEELWGNPINLDFYLFTADEVSGYLSSAGFQIEEVIERDPYPDVEYQSRRAYLFARKSE
ncbi:MAG: class I SAM-dependent methyltransferase [Acidobacteriota bacterium]